MTDQEVMAAKAELDAALGVAGDNVGIAFGIDLFEAFKSRQWFTLETFSALGIGAFPMKLPAYDKSHFVFPSWDVDAGTFQVGTNA